MKAKPGSIMLALAAVGLLAACAGEGRKTSAPPADPLLGNYQHVLTWQSGRVVLRPPDEVDYSRAAAAPTIEAELAAIRAAPCACGGSWSTIVHRPLRDEERPETSIYSEWVLACQSCGKLEERLFRVASTPDDYDMFFELPRKP